MAQRPKNSLASAVRQRLANALAGGGVVAPDQMMPAPHVVAPPGFGGSLRVDPTETPTPGMRAPTPSPQPGFRLANAMATPDRSVELRAMLGPPLSPRVQEARANALLAQNGLPEDIWNLPHRDQADAFEKWLGTNGIPYERYKANEGSRYYTVPTGPGEDAPDVKIRFANHSNLSRLHGTPDYNITTDRGGDSSVDELIGVLGNWLGLK